LFVPPRRFSAPGFPVYTPLLSGLAENGSPPLLTITSRGLFFTFCSYFCTGSSTLSALRLFLSPPDAAKLLENAVLLFPIWTCPYHPVPSPPFSPRVSCVSSCCFSFSERYPKVFPDPPRFLKADVYLCGTLLAVLLLLLSVPSGPLQQRGPFNTKNCLFRMSFPLCFELRVGPLLHH